VADFAIPAQSAHEPAAGITPLYAWAVFGLTFGLLLSDLMSRQVLNAVFPLLKADWGLSDANLGKLVSVVALMVGLLTLPISLLADHWGRVRSLVLMALIWSLATLGCALARNFEQMLVARLLVGIGEAAYGSVGIAVVLSVFPSRMRASITGAFMAGGLFGSMLGMALGGVLAAQFGWRWSFAAMAFIGLALAAAYPIVVREAWIDPQGLTRVASKARASRRGNGPSPLRSLYASRSVICAYLGSALQMFITGGLLAWMPSFLNRFYAMSLDRAGVVAAGFVLISGAGSIVCGVVADRISGGQPLRKVALAFGFCLFCAVSLWLGFHQAPGLLQLGLIGAGMFTAFGTSGPAGAMVANLTHPSIHSTAFATFTLANGLIGLAPAPVLIGMIADGSNLLDAFQYLPLAGLAAAGFFAFAYRHYLADLAQANKGDR
jgi:MFS family permease